MNDLSEHPYLRKPEPYLKKTEPRGSTLFALLRPHLRKGDKVLDSGCGYSPMAEHLLGMGYEVTGFDIYPDAIAHLKNNQPMGEWWCIPYEEFHFTGYTVLFLLGASDAWNGEDFKEYLLRTIAQNHIRLIFMEMAHSLIPLGFKPRPRVGGYNHALSILLERGYRRIDSGHYDSGMEGRAATRTFDLLARTNK